MNTLPNLVEWEITGACDLRCPHCHRADSRRVAEPGLDRVLALADALLAAGARAVALSGGEPTLSPHLWPAVGRLKGGGAFVSLITNGRDDSEAFALRSRDTGLDFVWLSLDGSAAVHDAVRGRDGVFARLMRTREHLVRHEVPFGFMTTLLAANVAHLEALTALVGESGAALWQLQFGLPTGAAPERFLDASGLAALRPVLARLRAREPRLMLGEALALTLGEPSWIRSASTSAVLPEGPMLAGCPSGRGGFAVSPDGRLRGCSCLPDDGAGPRLTDAPQPGPLADGLSRAARGREHTLAPAALACGGQSTAAGFCHALALRHARLEAPARACDEAGPSPIGTNLGTASVAVCSVLLSGLLACSSSKPPAEDKTTPPEAGPPPVMTPAEPTPPPAEPEPVMPPEPAPTADATPTDTAPGSPTTNVVAPSSEKPGMKPAEWTMPKCCMMHVLQPGCVCSPPPGTIPVP